MEVNFTVTFLEDPKIEGTAFSRSGNEGLADSIASVQNGYIRASPAFLSIARVLNPGNDEMWIWFDSNAELAHPSAAKDYGAVKSGDSPYVFIVNGQTFSHYPDNLIQSIRGDGAGLVSNSVPLSAGYADRVFGDNVVWAFKDGKTQEAVVPLFTLDQFYQSQKDPDFLRQHPAYMVLMTEHEAQGYRHNREFNLKTDGRTFTPDARLVAHAPSYILSGTTDVWNCLLAVSARVRGISQFYASMPVLPKNSGRVSVVLGEGNGFDFCNTEGNGRSVGVRPEALDALVSQFIAMRNPSARLVNDVVTDAPLRHQQKGESEIVYSYSIKYK